MTFDRGILCLVCVANPIGVTKTLSDICLTDCFHNNKTGIDDSIKVVFITLMELFEYG